MGAGPPQKYFLHFKKLGSKKFPVKKIPPLKKIPPFSNFTSQKTLRQKKNTWFPSKNPHNKNTPKKISSIKKTLRSHSSLYKKIPSQKPQKIHSLQKIYKPHYKIFPSSNLISFHASLKKSPQKKISSTKKNPCFSNSNFLSIHHYPISPTPPIPSFNTKTTGKGGVFRGKHHDRAVI
jgi:hypothetical protein